MTQWAAQDPFPKRRTRYPNPVKKLREHVPSAVRIYAGEVAKAPFSDRTKAPPITEKHFSQKEMQTLRGAVKTARQKGRNFISYGDYGGHSSGGWNNANSIPGQLRQIAGSPAHNMELTLGQASFDRQGVLHDKYDFMMSPKTSFMDTLRRVPSMMRNEGTFGFPEALANLVGLRKGRGRSVRIDTGMPLAPNQREYRRPRLEYLPRE